MTAVTSYCAPARFGRRELDGGIIVQQNKHKKTVPVTGARSSHRNETGISAAFQRCSKSLHGTGRVVGRRRDHLCQSCRDEDAPGNTRVLGTSAPKQRVRYGVWASLDLGSACPMWAVVCALGRGRGTSLDHLGVWFGVCSASVHGRVWFSRSVLLHVADKLCYMWWQGLFT